MVVGLLRVDRQTRTDPALQSRLVHRHIRVAKAHQLVRDDDGVGGPAAALDHDGNVFGTDAQRCEPGDLVRGMLTAPGMCPIAK